MGKRSNFARVEKDFYPTPASAVLPLLPHLAGHRQYYEPCAGDGALIEGFAAHGIVCQGAWDTEPRRVDIYRADARDFAYPRTGATQFITNPPWSRETLHPIILNLSDQLPTWLLFDADWMHTRQAVPYMARCRKIVSVGRVKWIPDSPFTGKDNCCWYLFDSITEAPAQFVGRAA